MSDSKAYSFTEKMLSWGRYLYWTDIFARRFDCFMEKPHDVNNDVEGWEFFALMSHWYAGLWVVVEGWQELDLHDELIDNLINGHPDFCELLKRYRNGVFHYQPRIIEERFLSFLREGDDHAIWMHNLHNEFLRFFWEWINQFKGTDQQKEDLQNSILAIVGWIPSGAVPVQLCEMEKMVHKAESLLAADKDGSNSHSFDLQEAILNAKKILVEVRDSREKRLKKNARNDN